MWFVMIGVGAGSYLFRVGPLLLLQRVSLSARADRAIRHAGLAALTALIALSARHAAHGPALVPTLASLVLGAVLAARRVSLLRIIVAGGALYAAVYVAITGVA